MTGTCNLNQGTTNLASITEKGTQGGHAILKKPPTNLNSLPRYHVTPLTNPLPLPQYRSRMAGNLVRHLTAAAAAALGQSFCRNTRLHICVASSTPTTKCTQSFVHWFSDVHQRFQLSSIDDVFHTPKQARGNIHGWQESPELAEYVNGGVGKQLNSGVSANISNGKQMEALFGMSRRVK